MQYIAWYSTVLRRPQTESESVFFYISHMKTNSGKPSKWPPEISMGGILGEESADQDSPRKRDSHQPHPRYTVCPPP